LESSANDSDRSGNFALDFHMIPETAVSSKREILRKHVLNRKTDFCVVTNPRFSYSCNVSDATDRFKTDVLENYHISLFINCIRCLRFRFTRDGI